MEQIEKIAEFTVYNKDTSLFNNILVTFSSFFLPNQVSRRRHSSYLHDRVECELDGSPPGTFMRHFYYGCSYWFIGDRWKPRFVSTCIYYDFLGNPNYLFCISKQWVPHKENRFFPSLAKN